MAGGRSVISQGFLPLFLSFPFLGFPFKALDLLFEATARRAIYFGDRSRLAQAKGGNADYGRNRISRHRADFCSRG